MVDGNGTETGHIIVTTIGGRNGQSKQVNILQLSARILYSNHLQSIETTLFWEYFRLSYSILIFVIYFSVTIVTDNKLHGGAYSWAGILRYCISGNAFNCKF